MNRGFSTGLGGITLQCSHTLVLLVFAAAMRSGLSTILQQDIHALADSKCLAAKNRAGHDEQTQNGKANALSRGTP